MTKPPTPPRSPLSTVRPLHAEAPAAVTPQASAMAVDSFNAAMERARTSEAAQPGEDPKAAHEAATGPLDAATAEGGLRPPQVEDTIRMSEFLAGDRLVFMAQKQIAELMQVRLERALRIEAELPPLDFTDFLLRDWISQEVRVAPRLTLVFRSIDPALQSLAAQAAAEVLAELYPARGLAPAQATEAVLFDMIGSLACGLHRVNGVNPHPHDLDAFYAQTPDADLGALRTRAYPLLMANIRHWARKPSEFTQELIAQQAAFHFRLRKCLGEEGAELAKKS